MTAEVFADCTQTGYEYDVHHNPILITDANDSVIDCKYDLLDRLTDRDIDPGPGVADETNGGTTSETFAWDGLSRLVSAEDKYSPYVFRSKVALQYDSLSNVISDYQAYRASPGAGHNWAETTATFDGDSNMLTCTYPGDRKIACTYDVLDLKKTITDVTDAAAPAMIASYVYVGRRVAWRDYGNNTRMDYAYDGLSNLPGDFGVRQVVGTTHSGVGGIIDDRTYAWDQMYNKVRRKDVRAGGPMLTHDYTYDRTYRLIHTAVTNGSPPATVRDTTYNLDGVHNRLSVTGTPGPATGIYAMNIGSGNCTITDGIPGTPIDDADLAMNQYTTTPTDVRHYDRNGNLTLLKNDTAPGLLAISCLYDYRNRMVEYKDKLTDQRHTYAYDALGRRIAKTIDTGGVNGTPTTTRYFYGGESQWQVCEEQVPDTEPPFTADATIATYVYGRYIDEVLQMQRCEDGAFPPCNSVPPVDYYYHTDDLYNVMAVTDAAGNVVERYEYDDYGTPMFMDATGNALTLSDGTPRTSSAIANPYLFTGRRYDPESGWYNYRTRYLDPKSGKFTTRDVIGIWGDPAEFGNGYTYVENSPQSWIDPFGETKSKQHTVKTSDLPSNWGKMTRSQKIKWVQNKMLTASKKAKRALAGVLKLVKKRQLVLGPVGAFFCIEASTCYAPMIPLDYLDPGWLKYLHRICWKIENACKSKCNSLYPPENDSVCFFGDSPNEESRQDCKKNCFKKRSQCDDMVDSIYGAF